MKNQKQCSTLEQQLLWCKFIQLGLPNTINTLKELIANVKSRCEEKINPEKVIYQLKRVKNHNTTTLCSEVETLTTKLKGLYLDQNIPENIVNDMIMKIGKSTLIDKLNNPETNILLKVGQF